MDVVKQQVPGSWWDLSGGSLDIHLQFFQLGYRFGNFHNNVGWGGAPPDAETF